MAMRCTYMGKVMSKDDFLMAFADEVGESPFIADISALIYPSLDGIDVEIISIKRQPDGKELGSYARRDFENDLKRIMRTYYLNQAREGLEGDCFSEEIA